MMEKKSCGKYCILEHAHLGLKFLPSGQEICEFYLKLKLEGKELPCMHMIADKNLYEDHSTPWEIFKTDDSCWSLTTESSNTDNNDKKIKKVMYVFTMLKKKGGHVLRKAGCGTWSGQHKKTVKNEEGGLIGYDRLLTFKIDNVDKMNDDHGNWTLHQYTLHPNDYNYAICKITKEEHVREKFDVGSDVVLQGFPHLNMSNQEEPLLDEEWGSYTETLNNILEAQQEGEEEREACDQIDALAIQDLSDRNVVNKLAESQTESLLEREWRSYTETVNNILEPQEEKEREEAYCAADQIDALAVQEPFDENIFNKLSEPQGEELGQKQQVLLVEQEEQQVFPVEQEEQQVFPVEQEEHWQESERTAFITHLAGNFNYYYGLQHQQQLLEGGQSNSLGKRKNRSYHHEDELSNTMKKQHTMVTGLN